jgi:hypothetical protein
MFTHRDGDPPTAHEIRQVAVAAICCGATVRRYFAGQPVRSTSRARIEEALRNLGLKAASFNLAESRPPGDSDIPVAPLEQAAE